MTPRWLARLLLPRLLLPRLLLPRLLLPRLLLPRLLLPRLLLPAPLPELQASPGQLQPQTSDKLRPLRPTQSCPLVAREGGAGDCGGE